jgi:hypothetical protein
MMEHHQQQYQQDEQQQQCRRQHRHRHRRVTSIFLMLLTVSSTIEFSYGWTTSSSNNNAAASTTKTSSTTTKLSISKTAAFYKTLTTDDDDFQTSVPPLPPSPPVITSSIRKRGRMHNGIYSIRDIHHTHKIKSKKEQQQESSYPKKINRDEDSIIIGSQLPWIDYKNENKNKNEKYENNVYLSHWEWQLSYFNQHLTNFRINDDTTEAPQQEKTTDDNDLMYTTDEQQKDQQQRIYTVSYQSDEYRDIRITYMNFPGSQFFRCMCYPNSINIPILGMAYMQFGSNGNGNGNGSNGSNGGNGSNGSNSITKNMAFMDYQPILVPASLSTSDNDNNVNNKYKSELLRIRSEIPSMNTPISHKHFDSEEERKYFTDCPLICKWDNDNDSEFHHQELVRAQHDYIQTHIKLTKEDRMMNNNNNNNNNNNTDTILLKLHSDFDTFVSSKEPAGKLLCHAFGHKIGNQLVHRILFPLSRNKI